MEILVINAGSSSVKFTLFQGPDLKVLAKGGVERIGIKGTLLYCEIVDQDSIKQPCSVRDTHKAIERIAALFFDDEKRIIHSKNDICIIGHRVVHGGDKIHAPVLITPAVKNVIKEFSDIAPLHNPPALAGIEACENLFPKAQQVAVFDTAFHMTLPAHAFLYGLPLAFYRDDKIRKFGFHGISHKYGCTKAAHLLNRPLSALKIISCHLGNGCSITAVDQGKSIETSMGFTPMDGLLMGTRSGEIDPGILIFLSEKKQMTPAKINHLLNRESGLFGMSGIGSCDVRDIEKAADCGNLQAKTALKVFIHRIRKTIGGYAAILSGLDLLIFTGGIGENAASIRERICSGFTGVNTQNIILDPKKNVSLNSDGMISHPDSPVAVAVIPANEEREIATQALERLNRDGNKLS